MRTLQRAHFTDEIDPSFPETESHWFNDRLSSVDRLLFKSQVIVIGRFDCSADHELFADSGEIRNTVVVFPRSAVRIRHDKGKEFVSTPNQVNLYIRGQKYSRQGLGGEPRDICDWFAVSPAAWESLLGVDSKAASGSRPFERLFVELSDPLFVRERALVARLTQPHAGDETAVFEESVTLIGDVLRCVTPGLRDTAPDPRKAAGYVEHVKGLIADHFCEPLPLRLLASQVGLSVYYLCKLFRSMTGTTMHAYRTRLRLRYAIDRVLGSDDLLTAAIAAGFSSHSHFTDLCRRYLGHTPSAIRQIAAGSRDFATR